jgi:DNA polymerase IV (archaeal DinB-like DNA polymerase)
MQILKMFCTNFEQVSIDEAYLDITDFAEECFDLEEAGNKIKQMVFEETNLTCSIGIATSRYVAKIASDHNKPNGVTVVENQKEFLQNLPISKISGIGKVTSSNLEKAGIKTINDFANADYFRLNDIFGDWIIHVQKIAKGEDETGVYENYEPQKSISRETTFEEDITLDDCYNEIENMAEEISEDMNDYYYKKVSIKIRYSDFKTITREISLKVPQNDKKTICNKAKELLKQIQPGKIRLFGIKINDLTYEEDKQTMLKQFLCG